MILTMTISASSSSSSLPPSSLLPLAHTRGGGGGRGPSTPRAALPLRYLLLAFTLSLGVVLALGLLLAVVDSGAPAAEPFALPSSVHALRASAGSVRALVHRQPLLSVALLAAAYLTNQAFAVPGSALLNALIGVAFGTPAGVVIASILCGAGATCGYLLSAEFGPHLLARFGLEDRVWPLRMRVEAARKRGTLFLTLLSMRVFPGSPHWAINYAAPHAGVPLPIFAASAALGMSGYNAMCVYAGDRVATTAWGDVFSWHALGALAFLAVALAAPAALPPRSVDALVKACRRTVACGGGGTTGVYDGGGAAAADDDADESLDSMLDDGSIGIDGEGPAKSPPLFLSGGGGRRLSASMASGADDEGGGGAGAGRDSFGLGGGGRAHPGGGLEGGGVDGGSTETAGILLFQPATSDTIVDGGGDNDRERGLGFLQSWASSLWGSSMFKQQDARAPFHPPPTPEVPPPLRERRSGGADSKAAERKAGDSASFRQQQQQHQHHPQFSHAHHGTVPPRVEDGDSDDDTSGDQAGIALNAWPLRRHL